MRKSIVILSLVVVLAVGCKSQVRVVEVEVTAAPQVNVVEVTATSAPTPIPVPVAVTVCANGCDFTTIQAAIDDVYTIAGSSISVIDDIHTEADVTVNKDVVIRGHGAEATIVQAHEEMGGGDGRVFYVVPGVTVTIEGITIRHGHPDKEPHILGVRRSGGGIVNQGTLTLRGCVVRDNISSSGGGIWNNGDLTVNESVFRDNVADGIDEQLGQDCGSGGGIKSAGVGSLWLINSTVSGNSANGYGGGVKGSCAGTIEIVNSTISGNEATEDGGGVNAKGEAKFVNSTISGNSSAGHGGGIYVAREITAEIVNCTITGNHTDLVAGGGIYVRGVLNYANNVIAHNTSSGLDSTERDCIVENGTLGDNANNLVEDGGCSADYSGDPMLDVLADNGGPLTGPGQVAQTHALLSGSPAIDAVSAEECAVDVDQRGNPRPQGGGCDIGAYELEQD
ncbi:MAG: right-handed parallel beta-helix repeat-containing protein [Chloroflexi bacterium]|nr:right-handed parallel beta-helix repeat-containing protein [Chloroflexota bacterium]